MLAAPACGQGRASFHGGREPARLLLGVAHGARLAPCDRSEEGRAPAPRTRRRASGAERTHLYGDGQALPQRAQHEPRPRVSVHGLRVACNLQIRVDLDAP